VDKLKFDGSVDALRQSVRWDEVGGMGFGGIELGGGAEFFYSDTANWEFFMDKFRENFETIAA
jgi:hypothetical protein